MPSDDAVRAAVGPVVEAAGLTLYDLVSSSGSLQVLVDKAGGIDLDEIGTVSKAISAVLDEIDPIPGGYTLEVSSPGLERPLRTPVHFAGAVGEQVTVRTNPGTTPRRASGVLVSATDDGIVVRDEDGAEHAIALTDVERARTRFDWAVTPKKGSSKS